MTTVKKVNERINEEMKKLYKEISENLGELLLKENNIEEILKNLEKILYEFLEDVLDLELFKIKRSEIRSINLYL